MSLRGVGEGVEEGAPHPCLGGLDVKACFLHSRLGWRARQSHLVIHVCVIHITCTSHMLVLAIIHMRIYCCLHAAARVLLTTT